MAYVSELPLRKEKIECGVFSFKIHKKYMTEGVVPNFVEGNKDAGYSDLYSPNGFTFFMYDKVPDCNKWRLEEWAKYYTDDATEKDRDGFQKWFVSDEPLACDYFISTDYHQSKHNGKRQYRRDIIFFKETEDADYYLCHLSLYRPTKFTLNRSHEIFFKNLRISGKKPVHPRRR